MANTLYRTILFSISATLVSCYVIFTGNASINEYSNAGAVDPSARQKRQTFQPYNFDTQFEIIGAGDDKANAIRSASVGAIDMVGHALAILETDNAQPPTNPSFLRYFEPQHLPVVKGVLRTVFAVLGGPNTESSRGCIPVPKMQIMTGHPLSHPKCDRNGEDALAYLAVDEQGKSFMVLCPSFFEDYKRHDLVDCNTVDRDIDPGYEIALDLPTSSASVTFFHELLHWNEMTSNAGGPRVVDARVTRTNNNVRTVAYRAYYSMKLKDPAWQPSHRTIENADNYAFMVLELYYGLRCPNVLPWQDPPDSQLEFPPH